MKKKFFITFFTLALIGLSMGAANAQTWQIGMPIASALTATLSSGTLTISGTGDMQEFGSPSNVPWYNQRFTITALRINNGVTSISNSAFQDCLNLTSTLTLPNSLTKIGDGAFMQCEKLTGTLTFPNGLSSIGNDAFEGCSSLTGIVTIPASTTSIGDHPFRRCSGLTSINVAVGNTNYSSIDGILYNKTQTTIIKCPEGRIGTFPVIPATVTTIGEYAFSMCSGLTGNLTIPNTVTTLNGWAFEQCSGLTGSLTLPNTITSIANDVFYHCTGFNGTLTLPNFLTSIGSSAFNGCSGFIGSLILPDYINSIGNYAFESCTGFTSVTARMPTPIAISAVVFQNVNISGLTLYVPGSSRSLYQAASVWQNFGYVTVVSSVADLATLTVSGGTLSPVFAANTTAYSLSVANDVESIVLSATTADQNATIVAGALGTKPLAIGTNLFIIEVTAQNGTTTKNYVLLVTRIAGANANLAALTVSEGTLSPAFNAATTQYSVNVAYNITTIDLSVTTADSNASITGGALGTKPLIVGTNTFPIEVTAQNGTTTKTYTVTVTRDAGTNANLASLSVSQGTLSPAFAANIVQYSVSVANNIATIDLSATTADPAATIAAGESGTKTLNVGVNSFPITVTAPDGTTIKAYTITVTRAAGANADLASLGVSQGTLSPAFAASTTGYSVSVDNNIAAIDLSATTASADATIAAGALGTKTLNVGVNIFLIEVSAQNGLTTKTYIVLVTRAAASANANLASLGVSTGTLSPTFSASIMQYSVSVAHSITSIMLSATAVDPAATIAAGALGTKTLDVGTNAFYIEVTAPDGTMKTYVVTIIRAANANADLATMSVSEGVLSPAFDPATQQYSVTVANNVESIDLLATTADPTATIAADALGTKVLPIAINNFPITVTAQDGTTKTYTITVTRATAIDNNDVMTTTITVYPNPATDQLRIVCRPDVGDVVEVYSMQGVLMGSYRMEDDTTIDVSALPAGVYFVKIGQITKKFIKQ